MRARVRLQALSVGVALLGAACLARAGWMQAKAALAQRLIGHAWSVARRDGRAPPPWPGADLKPVARLTLPGSAPLYVLEGASGRALAFGPVHDAASVLPGEPGNSLIEGHRDTHFAALRTLQTGEPLEVERLDGTRRVFRVRERRILDARRLRLVVPDDAPHLVLATCWPFDAAVPGGPMRLVVLADPVAPDADGHGPPQGAVRAAAMRAAPHAQRTAWTPPPL